MIKRGVVLTALALAGMSVGPAAADEAKIPVSATMMLNILSAPVEPREAAYDRALKEDGPAPRAEGFVLQPDGSMVYGSGRGTVTVTVKNPCPPGSAHYEPPPLPGRRLRN
ncbi:MAG: hypothetical protein ACREJ9_05915 [Candidatus Rokuibacteriota bacterium]